MAAHYLKFFICLICFLFDRQSCPLFELFVSVYVFFFLVAKGAHFWFCHSNVSYCDENILPFSFCKKTNQKRYKNTRPAQNARHSHSESYKSDLSEHFINTLWETARGTLAGYTLRHK